MFKLTSFSNMWHLSEHGACGQKLIIRNEINCNLFHTCISSDISPLVLFCVLKLNYHLNGKFHTFTFSIQTHFTGGKNLISRQEIVTGERQFDELSFKGSLVAEQSLGLELWTLMLK